MKTGADVQIEPTCSITACASGMAALAVEAVRSSTRYNVRRRDVAPKPVSNRYFELALVIRTVEAAVRPCFALSAHPIIELTRFAVERIRAWNNQSCGELRSKE